MKLKIFSFFALNLCYFFSTTAFANKINQPDLELLTNYDSAQPQKEFYVGVRFKIKPDWHIYWQYPGEFGLPTRITFNLPTGFEVSELQWPAPEKFMQSGNQVGYGYSDEILLFSKVISKSTVVLKPEDFKADVRWLNCSATLCVPGAAELKLAKLLPATETNQIFKNWEKRVPILANSADSILKIEQKDNHAAGNEISLSLVLEWAQDSGKVDFFPALPKDLKISDVFISQEGLQSLVSFKITRLPGILAVPSEKFTALILPIDKLKHNQAYSFDVKL